MNTNRCYICKVPFELGDVIVTFIGTTQHFKCVYQQAPPEERKLWRQILQKRTT